MSNALKHDALGHRRCKTCTMWHNPEGQPIGFCVENPGQGYMVMQMPAPNALVRPDAPQMGPMPSIQSSPIPKGPEDGCHRHSMRSEHKH